MFLQASPTVNWTSNADPVTMVPVGPDVLALLAENIVVCYNHKTEEKRYFKGDNAATCAGITLLTGHIRYPLFAVAESVLRPRIFVISYPEMEKLTTIYSPENLTYVDIRFSDFGYLATLGGFPNFQLGIWNFRNGECYAEANSFKKCSRFALLCIKIDVRAVLQYSSWHNQILIWEVCQTGDQHTLSELGTIDLSNDFVLSHFIPVAYDWVDVAYVVNDFGEVFYIEDARMNLKHVWSVPNRINSKHSILFTNGGFVIINSEKVYFIKKPVGRNNDWYTEWTLPNPNSFIKLIVADLNNKLHASTTYGNIYRVQVAEQTATLVPEVVNSCYVINYGLFKGIKDEVLLLLTKEGDLRVVDFIRMNTISNIHIDGANSISMHNIYPIVGVGTTIGKVHFISYEKVRAPIELGFISLGEVVINKIRFANHTVLIKDEMNGIHILKNDYRNKSFQLKITLARESKENWYMLDMFLLDKQSAIVFLSRDKKHVKQYASEAWIYTWDFDDKLVKCAEYELPHKYRNFTILQQQVSADVIECMCVRLEEAIVDLLAITNKTTVSIAYSFETIHFTRVSYISGSRNVLTADTQSILIHFRRHKRSKTKYMISRALLCRFIPAIVVKMDACLNVKYLVVLTMQGRLVCYRLPLLVDCLRENNFNIPTDSSVINLRSVCFKVTLQTGVFAKREVTSEDIEVRELILQKLRVLAEELSELIDYDLSVTRQTSVDFRKFCLNQKWRNKLLEEKRTLLNTEYNTLLNAITEQSRIRDWISVLIRSRSTIFSTKLRSIFSNMFTESYSMLTAPNRSLNKIELFHFYDMEPLVDEIEERPVRSILRESWHVEKEEIVTKPLKRYVLEKGANVYEHVMAKDFELQDTRVVTFNQLYNEEAKHPIILINALKAEFNKNFILSKNFKEETMDNVYKMNAILETIYSDMNCLLCLLDMEQFVPPSLTVPKWSKDENVQKVLTVDDSEIKAINRHKKVSTSATRRRSRLLMWDVEFWKRALMVMMDGVVEKLWKEVIKQTPQPPEFMLHKRSVELTSVEIAMIREYLQKLKALEEDRRKYLVILRDDEVKTYHRKQQFIIKLNEHITAVNTLKMNYDFAIRHERLRLLNMKLTSFRRIESRNRIMKYRNEITKLIGYTKKHRDLMEFFERLCFEYKDQYEIQLHRNRQLYRLFKFQFLNSIPPHLTQEMEDIYKKRPKLPNRMFSTAGVCFEVAQRLFSRTTKKFPLPQELLDFFDYLKSMDSIKNCPAELEPKYWEYFTKLRRQRIESELRLKALWYYLDSAPKAVSFFMKEMEKLRKARADTDYVLLKTIEEYFDTVHNQSVELVLSLGQVEIKHGNINLQMLNNSVLLHVDDINHINDLIKNAGLKKIKSMQRVALFRRKITQLEWKHKMAHANIGYLQFILEVVQKCKVTFEFRNVLRNWHRLKELKATTNRVGVLENSANQRLKKTQNQLKIVEQDIEKIRAELNRKKRENRLINKQMDQLKISITNLKCKRDILAEEKTDYLNNFRMNRVIRHSLLANAVQSDYIKILELKAILDITRCRTVEMLPAVAVKGISVD